MKIVEETDDFIFERIETAWKNLQERCPDSTPFQTWEWNSVWWKHFRSRKRLKLLLFYDKQGNLVGLAPLYTSWHLNLPMRRLAWVGTGTSDYLEILADPDHKKSVHEAFLKLLNTDLRGWDIADLQQIRNDNHLLNKTAEADINSPSSNIPMEPCPYLPLGIDWDETAKSLGKKMRSNIRYYERLLLKNYEKAHFFCADSATLDDGMTAFFALHQSRWNARWLPGVLGSKKVQAFHREAAELFLEQDWLRLHLLMVDDSLRAALYCFRYRDRTYYYLGGFSLELAKYSLGTLLTAKAIQRAIADGCSEFDFLRGDEEYKYKWTSEQRWNHRLLILREREGMGGLGVIPGKAGFAVNRMERYIAHRAKLYSEKQSGKELKARAEAKIVPDSEGAAK